MARTVYLACPRCGHPEIVVLDSDANEETIARIQRSSGGRVSAAEDSSAAALRLERLKHLPTSLPVGGIITPV